MNPAYSVIFFTVLSGAGFGLSVWAGLAALAGYNWSAASSLFFAALLLGIGFVSSGFHLGRPERAWLAFSQWRSSWLSREAVGAATYGIVWMVWMVLWAAWLLTPFPFWDINFISCVAAIILILISLATLYATAMIYACLKPIPKWHTPWTVVVYLCVGLMSGLAIFNAHALIFYPTIYNYVNGLTLFGIIIGLGVKLGYWRAIARPQNLSNAESATGLGPWGQVSLLEKPHTQENYLQKEMGYQIARRHRLILRRVTFFAAFILPFALFAVNQSLESLALAVAGAVTMVTGLLVERWLFFAEAKHSVMLYYGERVL